jgi:tetratricopeptide (TPR) repeat protein
MPKNGKAVGPRGTFVVVPYAAYHAILPARFPRAKRSFKQGIFNMAAHGEPITPKKRLDSWKEIASFFGRDERTVKRWEKERGLPIYRVPGSARGGVFAYAEELTKWLEKPSPALEAVPAAKVVTVDEKIAAKEANVISTRTLEPSSDAVKNETSNIPASNDLAGNISKQNSTHILWALPLVLVATSFLVFSLGHRDIRFKNALAAPHVPSAEAQDLYLKGRYNFERRTPDDLNKAVDFFTQAIVNDPAYAAPYVGLADSYNLLREYGSMSSQEAFPRARAAASKAVELDPNSAEAHNSLAFATYWGFFDAATADREFKRAIELDSTLSRAHHWYATFLAQNRRFPEAIAEIERARQLNPSSAPILADKGFILAVSGKTEEARTLLTQLCASQPDFVHPHHYLADLIYFPEGNFGGYFAEEKTAARLSHDAEKENKIEAEEKGYQAGSLHGLLEARLTAAQNSFDHRSGSAFRVAETQAALGHTDEALKYLNIAYQRHDLALTELSLSKPFESLHQNPDFRDLAAKIGFPSLE